MSTEKSVAVLVRKLGELRQKLGLGKEQLAKALGFSRIAVLHWENGRSEPSAEVYIHLAKLAQQAELPQVALWFWDRAGVHLSDLKTLLPQLDKLIESRTTASEGDEIAIIPESPKISSEEKPAFLRFPGEMIPNRLTATYVRLRDDYMEPAFRVGDVLILDESKTDLWTLGGSWVAFHRAEHSISIRRVVEKHRKSGGAAFQRKEVETTETGLLVGVLHNDDREGTEMLLLWTLRGGGYGRDWDVVAFRDPSGAKIDVPAGWTTLGRVTAWISADVVRVANPQIKGGK